MATTHSYKDAKLSERGLWIKSATGAETIYLEPGQARKLAEAIMAQSQPAQRSAPTARRSAPPVTQRAAAPAQELTVAQRLGLAPMPGHRSATTAQRIAPTAQRSAPRLQRLTGAKDFTGSSSFQDPKMEQRARELSQQRAQSKLDSWVVSMVKECDLSNGKATGQWQVSPGGKVDYTIRATFG